MLGHDPPRRLAPLYLCEVIPADWGLRANDAVILTHAIGRHLNVAGDDAEKATRLLLRRLMHNPTEAIKAAAQNDAAVFSELESTLRRIFRIDKDDPNESDQT